MRRTWIRAVFATVGVWLGGGSSDAQTGTQPSALPSDVKLSWPFRPGQEWMITNSYGTGTNGTGGGHDYYALDFQAKGGNAATFRKDIVASASGRVLKVGNPTASSATGYGKYVVIDHGNGFATLYAHLDEIHPRVLRDGKGAAVEGLQQIGYAGHTGHSVPPGANHLHFEVLRVENGVLGAKVRPEPILTHTGFAGATTGKPIPASYTYADLFGKEKADALAKNLGDSLSQLFQPGGPKVLPMGVPLPQPSPARPMPNQEDPPFPERERRIGALTFTVPQGWATGGDGPQTATLIRLYPNGRPNGKDYIAITMSSGSAAVHNLATQSIAIGPAPSTLTASLRMKAEVNYRTERAVIVHDGHTYEMTAGYLSGSKTASAFRRLLQSFRVTR